MDKLAIGTILQDTVRGKTFRLEEYLGGGGFGKAYRAVEMRGDRARAGSDTCLKLTLHHDEWHGEVYFGGLLRGQGHVVQMNASFPTTVHQRGRPRTAFAIDMELIDGGTVRTHFAEGAAPWTEAQVRFRVKQLLRPLALLHGMGVSHRDVTPPNVFVGTKKMLKLGDFGITKAQLKPSGSSADVFNPAFAPKGLGRWWRPRDDVFQVGLLMATLLGGEEYYGGDHFDGLVAMNRITEPGPLRETLKDCLRPPAKRLPDASAVLDRLSRG